MDGNNLPYGTPRFEKAFLLGSLEDEIKNIRFMKSLDTTLYNETSKNLHVKIIEQHELNYKDISNKIVKL